MLLKLIQFMNIKMWMAFLVMACYCPTDLYAVGNNMAKVTNSNNTSVKKNNKASSDKTVNVKNRSKVAPKSRPKVAKKKASKKEGLQGPFIRTDGPKVTIVKETNTFKVAHVEESPLLEKVVEMIDSAKKQITQKEFDWKYCVWAQLWSDYTNSADPVTIEDLRNMFEDKPVSQDIRVDTELWHKTFEKNLIKYKNYKYWFGVDYNVSKLSSIFDFKKESITFMNKIVRFDCIYTIYKYRFCLRLIYKQNGEMEIRPILYLDM